MSGDAPGLCATCFHARRIVSGKGSTFWMCKRSSADATFPKYPRLPILTCRGYERGEPEAPGPRIDGVRSNPAE